MSNKSTSGVKAVAQRKKYKLHFWRYNASLSKRSNTDTAKEHSFCALCDNLFECNALFDWQNFGVSSITCKLDPGLGYSWEFLVGVCRPVLQILTRFQTKKCHIFPYLFSDQTSKIHTGFQTWPLGRNYVIITKIRVQTKMFLKSI